MALPGVEHDVRDRGAQDGGVRERDRDLGLEPEDEDVGRDQDPAASDAPARGDLGKGGSDLDQNFW